MRSTDPEQTPFRPFGEKVAPKPIAPPKPDPDARGPYGIVTGPDGKMRTTKEPK